MWTCKPDAIAGFSGISPSSTAKVTVAVVNSRQKPTFAAGASVGTYRGEYISKSKVIYGLEHSRWWKAQGESGDVRVWTFVQPRAGPITSTVTITVVSVSGQLSVVWQLLIPAVIWGNSWCNATTKNTRNVNSQYFARWKTNLTSDRGLVRTTRFRYKVV